MSDTVTGVVRFVHIISALMWVGGAFLWTMVIAPRVLRNGPPPIRRPFLEAALGPYTNALRIAAGLALLSGFVLVGQLWGWTTYDAAFQVPRYGPALSIGVFAGLAMAVVGFGIISPTAAKMLATMKTIEGPPTAEQQATLAGMGRRLGILGPVSIVLGTLAIGGMAFAVNVLR